MDDKQLIEALRGCTMNQCTHCPVDRSANCMDELMEQAADRLEQLTLPCKVGDQVWGLRSYRDGTLRPQPGIASEMYYVKGMRLHVVVRYVCRGEWGQSVFATEAEAAAAIEERKRKGGYTWID